MDERERGSLGEPTPWYSRLRTLPSQAQLEGVEASVLKLSNSVFTDHALRQMRRRQITEREVLELLRLPQEVLEVRPGRVVVQGEAGAHLLRVFVDVDRNPPEVVTVYRTSKIGKYRSER